MSDSKIFNRREAMRMLGATFMGAATLGGATYFATDKYQRAVAEADVDEALKSTPHTESRSMRADLLKRTEDDRRFVTVGYTKAATALGAFIGSEHYDWDMPSPFSVEPN